MSAAPRTPSHRPYTAIGSGYVADPVTVLAQVEEALERQVAAAKERNREELFMSVGVQQQEGTTTIPRNNSSNASTQRGLGSGNEEGEEGVAAHDEWSDGSGLPRRVLELRESRQLRGSH